MDTLKMQAVLNNYKKVLGNRCENYISNANIDMLEKVTGNISFVTHIAFLLNVIEYIENKGRLVEKTMETKDVKLDGNRDIGIKLYEQCHEVKTQNDELIATNNELNEKVRDLENLIGTYNKCYVQRVRLKNGEKIAYKKRADPEKVSKLKKAGLKSKEIAKKLCVSKSTVYRRLREKV